MLLAMHRSFCPGGACLLPGQCDLTCGYCTRTGPPSSSEICTDARDACTAGISGGFFTCVNDFCDHCALAHQCDESCGFCTSSGIGHEHRRSLQIAALDCDLSQFAAAVNDVNTACCNEGGDTNCAGGVPTSCDAKCAMIFNEFYARCSAVLSLQISSEMAVQFRDLNEACTTGLSSEPLLRAAAACAATTLPLSRRGTFTNCFGGTVLDLAMLSSPHSGVTSGSNHYSLSCGGSGNEAMFSVELQPGEVIDIGQSSNSWESRHETSWGGICPGTNIVACTNDPDTERHHWANDQSSPQNVRRLANPLTSHPSTLYGTPGKSFGAGLPTLSPLPLADPLTHHVRLSLWCLLQVFFVIDSYAIDPDGFDLSWDISCGVCPAPLACPGVAPSTTFGGSGTSGSGVFHEASVGHCPSGQRAMTSEAECAGAAVALHKTDTTISSSGWHDADYPHACYYKQSTNELYFNHDGDPMSGDADRVSLCATNEINAPVPGSGVCIILHENICGGGANGHDRKLVGNGCTDGYANGQECWEAAAQDPQCDLSSAQVSFGHGSCTCWCPMHAGGFSERHSNNDFDVWNCN